MHIGEEDRPSSGPFPKGKEYKQLVGDQEEGKIVAVKQV